MPSVTGTGTGSISVSSCFKCEKVFPLVDQLEESMKEFEIFTMELQFDPKSAKVKSKEVLSNFWHLISTIQSLKIGEEVQGEKKELCTTQTLTRILVSVQQAEARDQFKNPKKEHKQAKSKSESNPLDKTNEKRRQRQSNPKPTFNPNPNPNTTPKRLNEIKRAKALLRTIKCETGEGFYNVFECLKCQRQFSTERSSLKHIQNIHLNLGTKCTNCSTLFFTESSLDLHTSKCGQWDEFKKIKVWLKNDNKKPATVRLHPREKLKQQTKRTQAPSTQNRNRKSGKKLPRQSGGSRKIFDPLKIKVRNPFPNFSLKRAVNVKVVIARIKMDKRGKFSCTSQAKANEKIEIGTGTSSKFIAVEKGCKNTS